MLREIRLYGALAKFVGKRVLRADVASAAEAVRFLVANWPAIEGHMQDGHYKVSVGTYNLTLDEIHDPVGQQVIKITPVVAGAGGSAGQILAGVALIALAIAVPGLGAGATLSASETAATIFGTGFSQLSLSIGVLGASLTLTGIAGLIAPVPRADKEAKDPRKSFSFSGIQNTSRQNLAIPIIYGETIVGSIIASASIDIVQVKT
jgi:predicted phage tail protein